MIVTDRLRLRPMTLDDAPFYLQLVNEPSFLENIGDKGVRSVADARRAIEEGPMAMQKSLGYALMLVERQADGAALGMCGLLRRETLPATDIGYAYLPQYWGQGYAYEAAAAVLAHARDTLQLPRLMGIVSPGNTASRQLLGKLGLSYLGVEFLGGATTPTALFEIKFPSRYS
jgi:RimJ/RimL family protein N-acetyltransferase